MKSLQVGISAYNNLIVEQMPIMTNGMVKWLTLVSDSGCATY